MSLGAFVLTRYSKPTSFDTPNPIKLHRTPSLAPRGTAALR